MMRTKIRRMLLPVVALLAAVAIAPPLEAGKKSKKRAAKAEAEAVAAAAAAEQAPPAVATAEQLEPIAVAADRREYAEARRLLDELLPAVEDPAQKQQLLALRDSLHGSAEFERWRAVDASAREAAARRDYARALELAREAVAGIGALDLDRVGDAADDLRALRRHVAERALDMELAVDTERFNALASDGPVEQALALHAELLARVDAALEAPGGVSAEQRKRLEHRRGQLRDAAGYVWDRAFKDAAMLVIDGKRAEGRKALQRVVRECPVESVVAKARDGLIQMDQ